MISGLLKCEFWAFGVGVAVLRMAVANGLFIAGSLYAVSQHCAAAAM